MTPMESGAKPTLIIGDCHSHLDRLEALLIQEGIIGPCGMCGGSGDVGSEEELEFCPACNGVGTARLHNDAEVIQLGDLAHFGGSTTADSMIYNFVSDWVDKVLWGNHDRAVIDPNHVFGGYLAPLSETWNRMQFMVDKGQLVLAHATHGFLLTHAGMHASFKHNPLPESLDRNDPSSIVQWLNDEDAKWINTDLKELSPVNKSFYAIRDAIGYKRGGRSPHGGILWRDASEDLYGGFRQVFGHTAKSEVRTYQTLAGDSYCIDIGTEHNGRLAGIWLPDERIVEVQL